MNASKVIFDNEKGYVLVVALMVMAVLSLIGIAGINTSNIEVQIAGNEWVSSQTFYQADSGSELIERLIFENAVCTVTKGGFADSTIGGRTVVKDLAFSESITSSVFDVSNDDVHNKRYAVYYPYGNVDDAQPHTNFLSKYEIIIKEGSGLQMVSGYEGLGAGAAGGGSLRKYEIASQHQGRKNSESLIVTQWRIDNYILTSAAVSDCKY